MNDLRDYIVNADGWIRGQRRRAGEVIQLTGAQAKYENVSSAETDVSEAKPATRKSRKAD